jgi:hypothetical protein
VKSVEQDHAVDRAAAEALSQDRSDGAITRAPGAEPDAPGSGCGNTRLPCHTALDARHEPLKGFWIREGVGVGTRAIAEVDAYEHRAVHHSHPLFSGSFVAVKVKHHVEAVAEWRKLPRYDHLPERGLAAPRAIRAESGVRRIAGIFTTSLRHAFAVLSLASWLLEDPGGRRPRANTDCRKRVLASRYAWREGGSER